LQHIIVPVTRDSEPLREQYCFPRCVTLGICVLATIDFDDETLFETDKINNKISKGNLPAKFELREPAVSQQSPHLVSASVGSRRIFLAKSRMRLGVG
jgi:hypothetical protein